MTSQHITAAAHQDRPFFGMMLMLGFCMLAPMGDATAKVLGGMVAVGFLVCIRFAIQVLILMPLVWIWDLPMPRGRRLVGLTALRTVLHIAGIAMMFSALHYLPLADTVAIAFVMPFIMLILGKLVLNENVGRHRLAACALGFIGTLLVVQPNFIAVGTPALLPMGVAVVFALFMLVTRQMAKEVDPIGLQALSGLMATPLLGLALFSGAEHFATPDFSFQTVALLLLLGVLGTVAHLLMTWSLRFAPSATLAPMQYLEIPISTIIGYLVFRDLPNGLAAVGICITVGAGLYIILRERAIARLTAAPPQP